MNLMFLLFIFYRCELVQSRFVGKLVWFYILETGLYSKIYEKYQDVFKGGHS